MEQYLEFAKNLAYQAGEIMLQHFKVGVASIEKADLSVVTLADQEINDLVISEVNKNYPAHSVLGEEKSLDKKSNYIWLCDPIDGTLPYSKGLPISVFSLALVIDGVSVLGVVYDPFTKRLYHGVKGAGSFLNGQAIKVSDKKLNYQATLDVEWWPEAEYDIDSVCHNLSLDTKSYILHLGSIIQAACLVASGQYEACLFAGTIGKAVDIAAIKVIVEEAGGKVTDIFGSEQKYEENIKGALISNSLVHDGLIEYTKNI